MGASGDQGGDQGQRSGFGLEFVMLRYNVLHVTFQCPIRRGREIARRIFRAPPPVQVLPSASQEVNGQGISPRRRIRRQLYYP